MSGRIERADALQWLASQEPGSARVVCFDPPYSRSTPMRGREDGAAGSVYEPFGFLHQALELSARALLAPPASDPKHETEFGQQGPVRRHHVLRRLGAAAHPGLPLLDLRPALAHAPDLAPGQGRRRPDVPR